MGVCRSAIILALILLHGIATAGMPLGTAFLIVDEQPGILAKVRAAYPELGGLMLRAGVACLPRNSQSGTAVLALEPEAAASVDRELAARRGLRTYYTIAAYAVHDLVLVGPLLLKEWIIRVHGKPQQVPGVPKACQPLEALLE